MEFTYKRTIKFILDNLVEGFKLPANQTPSPQSYSAIVWFRNKSVYTSYCGPTFEKSCMKYMSSTPYVLGAIPFLLRGAGWGENFANPSQRIFGEPPPCMCYFCPLNLLFMIINLRNKPASTGLPHTFLAPPPSPLIFQDLKWNSPERTPCVYLWPLLNFHRRALYQLHTH